MNKSKPKMSLNDFEAYLINAFKEQRQSNPALSVRQYATDLGMSPPTLQKIIKKQRRLGLRVAKELAAHFGFVIIPDIRLRQKRASTTAPTAISISTVTLDKLSIENFEQKFRDFCSSFTSNEAVTDENKIRLVIEVRST